MAKLTVDLGSVIANGADGDTAREAFTKVNSNFTEVYDNLQNQSGNLDAKVDKVTGKSLVDNTEIAKLATVQANATQNNTDTYLLDRTNHTGAQTISTVSGLQAAIDSKANTLDLGTAAYEDAIAFEKLLSPGFGITIDRTNPASPVISAGGAGAGDVTGPNSSVANEVVLFDGLSGKNLKGGGILGTSAFTDVIETISQVEAETGTATTRRIFTSQRVRQAIVAWWNSASTVFGRSLVGSADASSGRTLLGLGSAATRPALGTTGALYSRDSILGTITQSAGVPTGAIIERGSNANGQYVRLADGTQICTIKTLSGGASSSASSFDIAWTFPATFVNADYVASAIHNTQAGISSAARGGGFESISHAVGSCVIRYSTPGSVSQTISSLDIQCAAIGRWY